MVFSLFKKKPKAQLGVDISSSAVKILELSLQSDGYHIEHYAIEPLPPGLVVDKNIVDIEALAQVIVQAVQKSSTALKEAVSAVSTSAVITRDLLLDAKLTDDEMDLQIQIEADQYIPYPLEEVSLDFYVRGLSHEQSDKADVLLVACRSDAVESRSGALSLAGLTPKVIDVESYAIERVLHLIAETMPGIEHQAVAVVDVGANVTTLYVLIEGEVVYSREQLFGGKQLTDEIQRRYQLSYEESGFAKKREGFLPEDYESEVLIPFKEAAAQQVIRALQFFFSSSQYSRVDRIILAGGTSCMAGLVEMIQEKTGTVTQLIDIFSNMNIHEAIDKDQLHEDGPALMLACGLALRSFE